MKKILKSPGLLERDVPAELDRRILLRASIAAARRRKMRRFSFVGITSGVAAAAAVVFMLFIHHPETDRKLSDRELLELSDWTTLEQEGYNLAGQLNCMWNDLPENTIS